MQQRRDVLITPLQQSEGRLSIEPFYFSGKLLQIGGILPAYAYSNSVFQRESHLALQRGAEPTTTLSVVSAVACRRAGSQETARVLAPEYINSKKCIFRLCQPEPLWHHEAPRSS